MSVPELRDHLGTRCPCPILFVLLPSSATWEEMVQMARDACGDGQGDNMGTKVSYSVAM